MTHKSAPDLDTETGLPRKLGWRVAWWAMGMLQIITIAILMKLLTDVDQLKTDVAYMKGRQGIAAATPALATTTEMISRPLP